MLDSIVKERLRLEGRRFENIGVFSADTAAYVPSVRAAYSTRTESDVNHLIESNFEAGVAIG